MNILSKKIGIIGGGQLGKMMILDAKRLGFYCVTLDPTRECPSHSISDEHIIAPFNDRQALRQLAETTDVMTYEFEHIDAEFLSVLEDEGFDIYPSPKSLLIIQDKFLQNTRLKEYQLPLPDFKQINDYDTLYAYVKERGFKGMLKSRLGGYDGKGNALITCEDEVKKAFESLGGGKFPLMIEELVTFEKEISVLACRGLDGSISVYPATENHHVNSILDESIVPARIGKDAADQAGRIAENVMKVFKGVGMFCVELFVGRDGYLVVNEVAPRPHNSGHYTIEACYTSQFEQHIRAITGLPFGKARLIQPSVMKNVLGQGGTSGESVVDGLLQALEDEHVKVHLYGKKESKPYRKMGHLTVMADTIDEAIKKARQAHVSLKIYGKDKI